MHRAVDEHAVQKRDRPTEGGSAPANDEPARGQPQGRDQQEWIAEEQVPLVSARHEDVEADLGEREEQAQERHASRP